MNRMVRKSKIIIYLIAFIAVLLTMGVWPFGVIHRTYKTASTTVVITDSNESVADHMVAQVFASEGDKLDWIDVYIRNNVAGERLDFAIYDGEFNRIYHKEFIAPGNASYPGYVRINTRLKLERGLPYIYYIYGVDNAVRVGLEDHLASSNTSLMTANYDGGEDAEHNIMTRMKYSVGFNTWQIVLIDVLIAIISCLLVFAGSKLHLSGEVRVQRIMQYIFNPVIAVFTVYMLYTVFPAKTFTNSPLDVAFFYIGILIISAISLYYVNYKREPVNKKYDVIDIAKLIDSLQKLLTVVSIAMVIWHCFEYMNGLFDIVHAYSARRIIIWFLIMIITTYSWREILNIFSGIWLIIGIPICYLYAKPYVGVPEEELLYRLNGWIVYAGGFVLICMLRMIISAIRQKKSINRLYLPYAIPYFIFIMLLVIKANTRWWPGYLAVMSVILVIRLLYTEDACRFLELLCDGILLNFLFMVVFSLMHRPYYGYIYHRYNMIYFTVTMTATHLAMVILAATVRLFIRYKRVDDIRKLIPDLVLFGMAGAYEFMTLSRTGYATVIFAVMVDLVYTVIVWSNKGRRVKDILIYTCTMILSVAVLFPVTFTLTRTIPALADNPEIYAYEPCIVTIYKGTEPDNENYMTVERFIDVFGSKVLNIGDSAASADSAILPESRHILLVSADEETPYIEESEEESDASNGRFDIFRSYIEQSNLSGHNEMGAILADGSEASHAHNIYLQAIYDHGWIVGIYISLFLLYTLIIGAYRSKKADLADYMLLVPVITMGFMVAGMVEWIFHPCNPYGLVVFIAVIPMIFRNKSE